ncbi:MAG: glycoside hydrolase family 3 N-terminal domain-containing protein, partial [Actinomycetota bacterium]
SRHERADRSFDAAAGGNPLTVDLIPYVELGERVAERDLLVMVGHLTVPGLTDGRPATQSPTAIELLRSIDGYGDALVVTDALGMAAVGLPEPEAAVAAIAAGVDVALFTRTDQTGPVIDAIVAAIESGEIAPDRLADAARRVMRLLERDGHTCDRPSIDR